MNWMACHGSVSRNVRLVMHASSKLWTCDFTDWAILNLEQDKITLIYSPVMQSKKPAVKSLSIESKGTTINDVDRDSLRNIIQRLDPPSRYPPRPARDLKTADDVSPTAAICYS